MALSLIAISYCTLSLYKYCMKISRDEKIYRQRCISNSVSQKHYITDMRLRLPRLFGNDKIAIKHCMYHGRKRKIQEKIIYFSIFFAK